MKVKYVLMDIEGTTSSIDFVKDVLFPYAARKLNSFVTANLGHAEVAEIMAEVKATLTRESATKLDLAACLSALQEWIAADRKHPALKTLQGLLWKIGYESGELKGHVYDDVPAALKRWTAEGKRLGIYSSGSCLAQRLLFGHSVHGDLNAYFSDNFDTAVGPKREASSYSNIGARLMLPPGQILFLSDTLEELDAAKSTGFQVIQLVRNGPVLAGTHPKAGDFSSL